MFLIKLVIAAFVSLIFLGLIATFAQGHNFEQMGLIFILIIGGSIAFLFTKLFQASNKKTLLIAVCFAISLFILIAGHFFSGLFSFLVTRFFGYLGGNENEYSYAMLPSMLFWLGALLINSLEISKPPAQKLGRLWKIYSIIGLFLVISTIAFTFLRNCHLIPERKNLSQTNV